MQRHKFLGEAAEAPEITEPCEVPNGNRNVHVTRRLNESRLIS